MKKNRIYIISLLFGVMGFTQSLPTKEIDSIYNTLKLKPKDSTFINSLFKISTIYKNNSNYDESFKVIQKARILAVKLNDKNNIAKSYLLESINYAGTGNLNQIIITSEKAKKIYEKTNYIPGLLHSVYLSTTARNILNEDTKKLEETISKYIALYKNTPHHKQIGMLYNCSALLNLKMKNTTESLSSFSLSLFHFKKIEFLEGELACYLELSNLSLQNNEHNKAIEYGLKALTISKKIKNYSPAKVVLLLSTLADAYSKNQNYSKALLYLDKAFKLNKTTGNKFQEVFLFQNISEVYYLQKNYDKTIFHCEKALLIKEVAEGFKVSIYQLLGKTYYSLKQYKKAEWYQDQIIRLINSTKMIDRDYFDENLLYKEIALTKYALAKYKEAYEYNQKYYTLETHKINQEKQTKVSEYLVKFSVKEKDLALKNLTIEKQKRELEFQKQKSYTALSIIIIISLIVFSVIVFVFYQINKKKNELLTDANQKLSTSQLLIQEALKEKETLLKEIHHRVKNNLQLVISLLHIQAEENDFSSIKDFLEKGQSRISSMALIHQNLYETENLGMVDFKEYVEKLTQIIVDNYNNKKIAIAIEVKDCFFDIQTAIPLGLILNELITNALKHAFPDDKTGVISLTIKQKNTKNYELIVADNGVGITNNAKIKKSLGLELVKLLVNQLHGSIESNYEKGVSYRILFSASLT